MRDKLAVAVCEEMVRYHQERAVDRVLSGITLGLVIVAVALAMYL